MATVGLTMVYVGVKGDDGQVILDKDTGVSETGVYAIDTNKGHLNLGVKTANITTMSNTPQKITGNNEVVDVTKPPAAPSVALDANLINPFVKQKILGRVNNGFGGYTDSDKPVDAGLIIESRLPVTMQSVFYCFGRGNFTETTQNIQTDTDTAETREDDNLTYTSLTYAGFNGKPIAVFYSDDPKFDKNKMFDLVFPGQKFVTASGDGTQDPSLHGGDATAAHGSSDTGKSSQGNA